MFFFQNYVFLISSNSNSSDTFPSHLSSSVGSNASSYGSQSSSIPHFEHPSHSLLKENNFVQHVYYKYHAKCMKGKKFDVKIIYWITVRVQNNSEKSLQRRYI